MKSTVLLLSALFFSFSTTFGQYKQNKLNYNHKQYTFETGDRYDPTIAGVASFFVPGLGQVLAGETGRGLAFFGGYVVSYAIVLNGANQIIDDGFDNSFHKEENVDGAGKILLGLTGLLAITVWSTIDAVRVAKVNNLAFRDQQKKTSFKIEPQIFRAPNSTRLAGGLQLTLKID